jgi:hypothetical protein
VIAVAKKASKKKGKKWGKIGAPGSAKRRTWMKKVRNKRKKPKKKR